MDNPQFSLDLGGRPLAGNILDRIRAESRDESDKGRWFEQLFMRVAPLGMASIWSKDERNPPNRAALGRAKQLRPIVANVVD